MTPPATKTGIRATTTDPIPSPEVLALLARDLRDFAKRSWANMPEKIPRSDHVAWYGAGIIERLQSSLAAAEAERDKLRAALERIDDASGPQECLDDGSVAVTRLYRHIGTLRGIARAAIARRALDRGDV